MKKYVIGGIIVILVVVGFLLFAPKNVKQPVEGLLGYDSSNAPGLPVNATEFNQVGLTASRSQEGVIKTTSTRVFAIEITSDATSLRYFQLFDMVTPTIPSRAASLSNPWIYAASQSWAKSTTWVNQPLRGAGAYTRYASPSLVFSVPILPATASSSPTVLRIDSSMFSPALSFHRGLVFAISSVFGSYSSASVTTARHTIKVIHD